MKENNSTVLVDWDEKIQTETDPLTQAYADLGKAFYDYRFEEPTPELLLYFDRITGLKNSMGIDSRREDHIEPISPAPKSHSSKIIYSNKNLNKTSGSAGHPSIQEAIVPEKAGAEDWSNKTVVLNTKGDENQEITPAVDLGFGSVVGGIGDLPFVDNAGPSAGHSGYETPAASPDPKFCPECGGPISADDVFCGNCGFRLK